MKKKLGCLLIVSLLLTLLVGCERESEPEMPADTPHVEEPGLEVLPSKEPHPVGGIDANAKQDPHASTDPVEHGDLVESGDNTTGEISAPVIEPPTTPTDINPFWFEDTLQSFLASSDKWNNKSYMVSPASFRAALCLAVEGASGETKDTLMHAAGFLKEEDMGLWYATLLRNQSEFLERYEALKAFGDDPGMGFDIANGVWDNTSIPGGFQQSYIEAISEKYNATAGSAAADKITADVNNWCAEKTHNMIQSISPDLSKVSSVLANALYVKSSWRETFSEYATEVGQFTMRDGTTSDVEFMWQTEDYLYYCDTVGREYASFELEGDLWFTVCLDSDARIQDMLHAMYNSGYENLQVKMPKLDMETALDGGELLRFLEQQGAGVALSDFADFSLMTDLPEGWHIDDIIQKTRIKTDEDGLEAAAVTAIMMVDNMAIIEPTAPIPFYMDSPFSFMITSGRNSADSSAQVLFFGQYLGA